MESIHKPVALEHRRYKRLTILAACVFSVVIGPFAIGLREGSLEDRIASFASLLGTSKWDLHRGKYRIKAIGQPLFSEEEYIELLRERYNVNVDRAAGCTPSPWQFAYSVAYDKVAGREIQNRFQKDVFDECYNEAERTVLLRRSISDGERQ